MATDFILHIPHDSTVIPDEYRNDFVLSDGDMEKEIIAMTDMHTADLYDIPNSQKIIFPVSRLLVDAERFPDDAVEPMAARGMGMLYSVTSTLSKLRDKPSDKLREELINKYYKPHHDALTAVTTTSLDQNKKPFIIDCHSFPSRPRPYEMADNNNLRADICIGTDDFHTPAKVKYALKDFFEGRGYNVSIDDPFAGALTPLKYYQQNKNVMAVMYEIRRDLYMDEQTGQKNDMFGQIKNDIAESVLVLRALFD